jgi:hypothetical protein
MASKEGASVNSRPTRSTPVIRHVNALDGNSRRLPEVLAACIVSALVNLSLVGLLWAISLLLPNQSAAGAETKRELVGGNTDVPAPPEEHNFENEDLGMNPNAQLNYNLPRIEQFSVPGAVDPTAPIGNLKEVTDAPPMNVPPPVGLTAGSLGQGGGLDVKDPLGKGTSGLAGGMGAKYIPGGFSGRSGATRKQVLEEGGGNTESEAAVARGLKWMANHQAPDGHWSLDGFNVHGHCNCNGFGAKYDIAATAFGLLPFLGAGETHLSTGKNSAYAKVVGKGLNYLMAKQQSDGQFSANMYEHGLATIAICEAYGLTADNKLKQPAQRALNFIASAQSEAGGWRYGAKQPGFDTSVAGWQLMALKSGQMSGLSVPKETFTRCDKWLDAAMDRNTYGYGYASSGSGVTTSAVGLLCREYRGWGPKTPQLAEGMKILEANPPAWGNMYYYYYATQVMHHFGGDGWKLWNDGLKQNKKTGKWEKVGTGMRDLLIAKQEKDQTKHSFGSWSPAGDVHGGAGGRIMITSMCLLTLEVYYRHLPLYRRDMGAGKDDVARDVP